MAVTGFWPVKGSLKKVIDYAENPDKTTELKGVDRDLFDTINYVSNPDKTDETLYVSAINCPKQRAYECMMETKQKYGKLSGNVAYHGFQSFAEGEVTPEEAHKIGIETAKIMWGNKYEVVVTTHLDKSSHIHNHFVWNSVSFKNGRKFENHISDHIKLRDVSDRLCKQYGKSILENAPFNRSEGGAYWYRKNGGLTKMDQFRADADIARSYANHYYQFCNNLMYLGYKFYNANYTAHSLVIVPGFKNPVRLSDLGDEYTRDYFRPKEVQEFVKHPVIQIFSKRHPNRSMWDSLYSLWKTILDFLEYLITKDRETGKNNIPLSPELRAELRDFNKLHKEYTFITDNKVYTLDDLEKYVSETSKEIADLVAQRQHIYNLCRRPKSDEELEENKLRAREISKQLRILRANLKFAKGLPERENKLFNTMQAEYDKEYPSRARNLNYER